MGDKAMKHNDELEIDLREILRVLRKRMAVVILAGVLGAGIAGVITKFFITPIYSSTTQLYILSKSTDITQLADLQIGTQLTQDYIVLINTRPVINKVIENLDLKYDYEEMRDKVSVKNPDNTRILQITVNDPDPELAQKMADELAVVTAQRVSDKMDTDVPNIIEEANLATEADSPNLKLYTLAGGFFGVLISAVIFIVLNLMNDSIRNSEEIERYFGLTVLASVPSEKDALQKNHGGSKKKRGK